MREIGRDLVVARKSVSSSIISSIGYDPSNGTLEIQFNQDGGVWHYFDVPKSVWNEFKKSSSHGKYFLANINNQYPQAKVH